MEKTSYKTRQRADILGCLRDNAEKSMTVDEIVLELSKRGCVVGRTTVYRYLDSLTEKIRSSRLRLYEGRERAPFKFSRLLR